MKTERYPLQALLERSTLNVHELSIATGIDYRTFVNWKRNGLTWIAADHLAIATGIHPAVVWPQWMDDSIAWDKRKVAKRQSEEDRRYRERHRDRINARRREWYRLNRRKVLAKLKTPEERRKAAAWKRARRAALGGVDQRQAS